MLQSTMTLNHAGQAVRHSVPECGSPSTWAVKGNSHQSSLIPAGQPMTTRENTVSKRQGMESNGASRWPGAGVNHRSLKSYYHRQRPAMCASANMAVHKVSTGQSTSLRSTRSRLNITLATPHPHTLSPQGISQDARAPCGIRAYHQ